MVVKTNLGPRAHKKIESLIDLMFEKLKARFLGPGAAGVYGKTLTFGFNPQNSLTGLFEQTSQSEGADPQEKVLNGVLKVAGSYIDAHKEKTKAKVIQEVQSFINDTHAKGIKTNVETVLGGKLLEVMGEMKRDIRRVVETESTITRNVSLADAIGRISAVAGIEEPIVFFQIVKDGLACKECLRLHVLADGVTPRLWKQSEIKSGYHKKGEDVPSVCGLHPHCRCCLSTLLPGYGFDESGRVTYKGYGWDEFSKQRGIQKSEEDIGEPLNKVWDLANVKRKLKEFGWVEDKSSDHKHWKHVKSGHVVPISHSTRNDIGPVWASHHLEQAGLDIVHGKDEVKPNPKSRMYAHYVADGKAEPLPEPEKGPEIRTWTPKTPHTHIPIENVTVGGNFDRAEHAKVVKNLQLGRNAYPPIPVMDMQNGVYGSMDNHHILQAAIDAGYTHVPVSIVHT